MIFENIDMNTYQTHKKTRKMKLEDIVLIVMCTLGTIMCLYSTLFTSNNLVVLCVLFPSMTILFLYTSGAFSSLIHKRYPFIGDKLKYPIEVIYDTNKSITFILGKNRNRTTFTSIKIISHINRGNLPFLSINGIANNKRVIIEVPYFIREKGKLYKLVNDFQLLSESRTFKENNFRKAFQSLGSAVLPEIMPMFFLCEYCNENHLKNTSNHYLYVKNNISYQLAVHNSKKQKKIYLFSSLLDLKQQNSLEETHFTEVKLQDLYDSIMSATSDLFVTKEIDYIVINPNNENIHIKI